MEHFFLIRILASHVWRLEALTTRVLEEVNLPRNAWGRSGEPLMRMSDWQLPWRVLRWFFRLANPLAAGDYFTWFSMSLLCLRGVPGPSKRYISALHSVARQPINHPYKCDRWRKKNGKTRAPTYLPMDE